jgi:hypothetical protein
MSIEFHPFIEKLEQNSDYSFSVLKLVSIKQQNLPLTNYNLVYVNSDYPSTEYDEVIYKTTEPVYLLLKKTSTTGYCDLECYFPADKLPQIKIFLNSILKKNDTTNIPRG